MTDRTRSRFRGPVRSAGNQGSRSSRTAGLPDPLDETFEVLTDESLEIIEANAERLMSEVGVEINDEYAVGLFQDAGATVDGTRVRFDPVHVPIHRAGPPPQPSTTQHARNPRQQRRDWGHEHRPSLPTTARRLYATASMAAATQQLRTSTTS